MRVGVISVVELDVVIATVSLLLYLESDEAELNAITLLGDQQPLAVRVTRVVIVPELRVRVEVLLTSLCFQTASTLCKDGKRGKCQS